MYTGRFGRAETRICNAVKMAELLFSLLREQPDLFSDSDPLQQEGANLASELIEHVS